MKTTSRLVNLEMQQIPCRSRQTDGELFLPTKTLSPLVKAEASETQLNPVDETLDDVKDKIISQLIKEGKIRYTRSKNIKYLQ